MFPPIISGKRLKYIYFCKWFHTLINQNMKCTIFSKYSCFNNFCLTDLRTFLLSAYERRKILITTLLWAWLIVQRLSKCHSTGKHPIHICDLSEWIWLSSYLTRLNSSNSALHQYESLRPADQGSVTVSKNIQQGIYKTWPQTNTWNVWEQNMIYGCLIWFRELYLPSPVVQISPVKSLIIYSRTVHIEICLHY